MTKRFPRYFFLIIIIFLCCNVLPASPNLSQIVKKNSEISYKKLKLLLPFDSVVNKVNSQKPYLKIFPVKDENFFLAVREYNGSLSFDNLRITSLENSFLPSAIYHPSTEYNFVKSFQIKKWSAELIKNGNELNAVVYLIKKENEFYTIWVVYRKYIPILDSVFQKVDFFTNEEQPAKLDK